MPQDTKNSSLEVSAAAASVAERVTDLVSASDDQPEAELLTLENARDDDALAQRLGNACRRSPTRLVVWQQDHEDGDHVPAERFFSFGFRRVFECREQDCRHVLYEYRLSAYKDPPDWLNARFWAHPERFDIDPDEPDAPGEVHS